MRDGHVQIRRLAQHRVIRRLVAIQEGVHALVGVLLIRHEHQPQRAVQRLSAPVQQNGRRAHRRDAALHVARAAPVDARALLRRLNRRMRPLAHAGHHVQMAAELQNRPPRAYLRDEVRPVFSKILNLAVDPLPVEDLLKAHRAPAAHFPAG